jgi:hypothetical protein
MGSGQWIAAFGPPHEEGSMNSPACQVHAESQACRVAGDAGVMLIHTGPTSDGKLVEKLRSYNQCLRQRSSIQLLSS